MAIAKGKSRKGVKQGGARLEKRGHPSYRSPFHLALAQILRARREELGLTLEEAAKRLPAWMSFHLSTLAKVERGDRDVTAQELFAIAEALETTIAKVTVLAMQLIKAAGALADSEPQGLKKLRKKVAKKK
jgi:transcriptional regulator with XRE-family HTH domain